MTPSEVSWLLLAIRAVDDRVSDDDARLAAWSAILDSRVTFEHAKDAVVQHYRRETRVIMPADVNAHARALRQRQHEEQSRAAITAGKGVPMPPEVRKRLDALLGRKDAD
jgi:hypothetical protein